MEPAIVKVEFDADDTEACGDSSANGSLGAYTFMERSEVDSKIIELVQKYPYLYNKQTMGFRDIRKKDNAFNEIAESLNLKSGEYVKKRFKSLREQYVRSLRTPPSVPGSFSNPVFQSMGFLNESIKRRERSENMEFCINTITTPKLPPGLTSELSDDPDLDLSNLTPVPLGNISPETSQSVASSTLRPPGSRKRPRLQASNHEAIADFTRTINNTLLSMHNPPESESDELSLYADYIRARVINLLKGKGNREQMKIRHQIDKLLDNLVLNDLSI